MRRIVFAALALILLGGGLLGWRMLRPAIRSVPVMAPGGELVVLGRGFGAAQGGGRLLLEAGGRRVELRDGLSWSGERIAAQPGNGERELFTTGADLRVRVVVKREPLPLALASPPVPVVVRAPDLPTGIFGYEVPVEEDAPWPLFRRDRRNTGRSPIVGQWRGDAPWSFSAGKGVFSTPVIDADGNVYVGAADRIFYALGPDGRERWRFETGEIIDSAAALPRRDAEGRASVVVPSGDGYLYKLWTEAAADPAARRAWAFDARVAQRKSYNDWFEGNVAIGPDGTFFAGNTNFNYYAIWPDGKLRWVLPTGANAWSMAAFGADGTIYWGSNDTRIRAVRPDGSTRWSRRTLGMIAASAALGSDGTVYIGSFDGSLHALDPHTGAERWSFRTRDHVYASAALGESASGQTEAVYFGSTDGSFYALRPDGERLWAFDTGDPIRSSAAVGGGPDERGPIVYFGSGNGRLYALHARDGTRRWSFDTTAIDPELADRNDLNGSVALGRTGVYVGSESGRLWYVPYDFCLHAPDPRCQMKSETSLPRATTSLSYVTPGGSAQEEPPAVLQPSSVLTFRLVVRRGGETLDARLCNTPFLCPDDAVAVRAEPPIALDLERSPDGRHLHVVPRAPLEPGQSYKLRVEADWYTPRLRLGNLALGGRREGRLVEQFAFRTAELSPDAPALAIGADETSAFQWTRAAVPVPTMLTSLNQIGFDAIDWIAGAAHVGAPDERGARKAVLLALGARRDAAGALVADPGSEFLLPLSGSVHGGDFLLASRRFQLPVTGIPIPFRRFELRGRFGPGFAAEPGASLYAETDVLSIPTFGKWLVLAGLANDVWRELVAAGTFVTRPYTGAASRRPAGVEVESVVFVAPAPGRDGRVTATLRLEPGARLPAGERRATILLFDPQREEAVPLPYREGLVPAADADGNLQRIVLRVPAAAELPEKLEAIVLVDVYPIGRVHL
jgi:outer membrane protein assembly factor BamB